MCVYLYIQAQLEQSLSTEESEDEKPRHAKRHHKVSNGDILMPTTALFYWWNVT